MKTVNAATNQENTTEYYIDVYGDIFASKEEAEVCGIEGKVIVDGFYVGSAEEMKQAAKDKYLAAE